MKHIESVCRLCSLLNRIDEAGTEFSIFLCIYGYDERPDIVGPDIGLIRTKMSIELASEAAQKVLYRICEEEKENGHPEIAVKAMELCNRLMNLEKEIETDKNMQ